MVLVIIIDVDVDVIDGHVRIRQTAPAHHTVLSDCMVMAYVWLVWFLM